MSTADERVKIRSVAEKFGQPDYPMTANICADYCLALLDELEAAEADNAKLREVLPSLGEDSGDDRLERLRTAIHFELQPLGLLRADPHNEGNFLGPGRGVDYAVVDAVLIAIEQYGYVLRAREAPATTDKEAGDG